MARLTTVKPRITQHARQTVASVPIIAERRISGRKLQERRKAIWTLNPTCAMCGRVVLYPHGFELDHIVPLYMGGEDAEGNCQVLCVWFEVIDGAQTKFGCHADKTIADSKQVLLQSTAT